MEWKSIRVFISSTFNDMHAERDYLVKRVFPTLSEWCEERKLRLVDIDLRWGISSEETINNNIVRACLSNIDDSRPFFLCFLGQRRGWLPELKDLSNFTLDEYPTVQEYIGKKSITEMEIEHALLSPMYHVVDKMGVMPESVKHALFFFRDGTYVSKLNDAQRKIFTNAADTDEAYSDEKLALLKQSISDTWDKTFSYSGKWNPSAISRELLTLGEDVYTGRLQNFRCGEQELADVIIDQLKKEIEAEYPERCMAEQNLDEWIQDRERQSFFEEQCSYGYVEREGDFDTLTEFIEDYSSELLIVTAPAGQGKTARLAQFSRELKQDEYYQVFTRFCGVTNKSSSLFDIWSGIIKEAGIDAPQDETFLISHIEKYLFDISDRPKRTVIIIDALNQMQNGLSIFRWLPRSLPPGLKIILSFKEDSSSQELINRLSNEPDMKIFRIEPYNKEEDKRALINNYLKSYLKSFDEEQIRAIINNPSSSNPLFLNILLSELRVFGSFGQLSEEILKYGSDAVEAFNRVLNRMEEDTNISDIPPKQFVSRLFGLLSAARNGLSEEELIVCLSKEFPAYDTVEVADAMRVYLRQERGMLVRREGKWDFFYESFRMASDLRYDEQKKANNRILYNYFRERIIEYKDERAYLERAYSEVAYHLYGTDNENGIPGERICRLLTDADYAVGKNKICGVDKLMDDYRLIPKDKRPEYLNNIYKSLRMSSHILREYPFMLLNQLFGRLASCNDDNIKRLLNGLKDINHAPALLPLSNTMQGPDDDLIVTLKGHNYNICDFYERDGYLISGDEGGYIRIWDKEEWLCVRVIRAYKGIDFWFDETSEELVTIAEYERMQITKIWDSFSGVATFVETVNFDGFGENHGISNGRTKQIGEYLVTAENKNLYVRKAGKMVSQAQLPVTAIINLSENEFLTAGFFDTHEIYDSGSILDDIQKINKHNGSGEITESYRAPRLDFCTVSDGKVLTSRFVRSDCFSDLNAKLIQVRDKDWRTLDSISQTMKFVTDDDGKINIHTNRYSLSSCEIMGMHIVDGKLFVLTSFGQIIVKADRDSEPRFIDVAKDREGINYRQLFMLNEKMLYLDTDHITDDYYKHISVSIIKEFDTTKEKFISEKVLDKLVMAVECSDSRVCLVCINGIETYISVMDTGFEKEYFSVPVMSNNQTGPYSIESSIHAVEKGMGLKYRSLEVVNHYENIAVFKLGKLFVADENTIKVYDDTTGKLIHSEYLGDEIALSVGWINGKVVAGTMSGKVVMFDPVYIDVEVEDSNNEFSYLKSEDQLKQSTINEETDDEEYINNKLGDLEWIWILRTSEDGQERLHALTYVDDQRVLAEIALEEKINSIRFRAAEKITDPETVKDVLNQVYYSNTGSAFEIFNIVAENCKDDYFLYRIAQGGSRKSSEEKFKSELYNVRAAEAISSYEYMYAAITTPRLKYKNSFLYSMWNQGKLAHPLLAERIILTLPSDPNEEKETSNRLYGTYLTANEKIQMLLYLITNEEGAIAPQLIKRYERLSKVNKDKYFESCCEEAGKLAEDFMEENDRIQKILGPFVQLNTDSINALGAVYNSDNKKRNAFADAINDQKMIILTGVHSLYHDTRKLLSKKIDDRAEFLYVLNNFNKLKYDILVREINGLKPYLSFCNTVVIESKNKEIIDLAQEFIRIYSKYL